MNVMKNDPKYDISLVSFRNDDIECQKSGIVNFFPKKKFPCLKCLVKIRLYRLSVLSLAHKGMIDSNCLLYHV